MRPGLRGHPFKVLRGPSRRLRRKSPFSTRVVKYWNRLLTSIVTAPSVNSFKRQLGSVCKSCLLKSSDFPSHLKLHNALLHYSHLCYPNPQFTVIHNRTNVGLVLYRITLPIFGYGGHLFPTLPLFTLSPFMLSQPINHCHS